MKNFTCLLLLIILNSVCLKVIAQTSNSLTLGNLVWNDVNGDGQKQPDEAGVAEVHLNLYRDDNNDNLADNNKAIATLTTATDGTYKFTGLNDGRYIVGLIIPSGYTVPPTRFGFPDDNKDNDNNAITVVNKEAEVRTNAITLTKGKEPAYANGDKNTNLTLDLAICGRSSIGDFVWNDLNGNGVQDATEPGIPNVKVTLTYPDGTTTFKTTDITGKYLFVNLGTGKHLLQFETPVGYKSSPSNATANDDKDSDPVNGSISLNVLADTDDFSNDAGFIKKTSDTGCPGNLAIDNSEYTGGFEAGNNFPINTGTDLLPGLPRNGSFQVVQSVDDLGGGGYLKVEPRSGTHFFAAHTSNNEKDRIWYTKIPVKPGQRFDFCAYFKLLKNLGNGANFVVGLYAGEKQIGLGTLTFDWLQICGTYTVPEGMRNLELSIRDPKKGLFFVAIDDICITNPNTLSLGNYVWNDNDGDGKKDPDEYGISKVLVSLYRDDNNDNLPDEATPIAKTFTDEKGYYSFTNLTEGRYIASIPIMPGFSPSPTANNNPDDNKDNDNNAWRQVGEEVFTSGITLKKGSAQIGEGINTNNTLDMGLCGNLWIGSFIWNDLNANGRQDEGEKGINGVEVTVTYPDGTTLSTKSGYPNGSTKYKDVNGYYEIPRIGPGTFKLKFATPEGYTASPAHNTTDATKDSDPINGEGTVTLTADASNMDFDAGFIPIEKLIVATTTNAIAVTETAGEMVETEPAVKTNECSLKVALEPKDPLCYNNRTGSIISTVTGNSGKVSYNWSNGSTGKDLNNIGEGNYSLKVKDESGCEALSETVTLNNPAQIIATIKSPSVNGYNIIGKGTSTGSIDLTVTGGKGAYTYEWSNGASTQDVKELQAGKYVVTIKDAVKCPLQTSITLTEPAQKLEVSSIVENIDCKNERGSVKLNVTGGIAPYTIRWNNGSTGTNLKALAPGTYTATIKDAIGYEVTESYDIKKNELVVKANAAINTLYKGTTEGTSIDAEATGGAGDYTYTWATTDGLKQTTNGNATVNPTATSDYNVTVKDAAGCTATAMVTINVIEGSTVARDKPAAELSKESIRVTPNPSNGNFNVLLNNFTAGKVAIKVLDVSGKEITTKDITASSTQTAVPFDLTRLPKGIYIVNVVTAETSYKEKVIIK